MKKESNRIEKKSILITVVIQSVLIFGLFFAIAWKEPNPPIPQYGLELGFELFNDTEKVSNNQSSESPTEDDQIFQENLDDNEIGGEKLIESKEIFESSEELQNDIINAEETDQIISPSENMVQSEVETAAIPDRLAQVAEDAETMPEADEEVESKDSAPKNMINKANVISQNSPLTDSLSELKDKLNRADLEKGTSNQNDKIDDRALYKTNSGSKRGTNEGPSYKYLDGHGELKNQDLWILLMKL